MYSSILFPVDLEHERSWKDAHEVVRKLAHAFGAKVHVLTVVADVRGTMAAQFLPDNFEEKVVKEAKQRLTAFIREHLADVAEIDGYVATGRPYKEIVANAERLGCDLIIIASHKPGVLDHLIGPNADKVIRHTKLSVMVVK